jgi:hypothetical protein
MGFLKALMTISLVAILLQGCGGGGGSFQCTSNCGTSSSSSSSSSGSGSSGGGTGAAESMGATVNGTFQAGVIGTPSLASGAQLAVGGSTQLSLEFIVTSTKAPTTDTADVQFTSKCPAGTVTITPATASNSTGFVTATYSSAGGCSLTQDTVTATVSSGGTLLTNKTATATIPLAQANANSIVFLSAAPTNIGLQGTGQPTSSVVTFQVQTAAGGPVANASVNFKLSTTLGGIKLVGANPATTGIDGKASITVQAGTRAQSVIVTATTTTSSGTVSADSNSLTVTTGIPDATRVSLSVGCQSPEAGEYDGVTVATTMRMKDRFSNPVPDGTPVIFATSGGGIGGQCLTTTVTNQGPPVTTESGLCTVTWTSQDPRPAAHGAYGAGRAVVLAVAVGEKHFKDQYGLGYFAGPPMSVATSGADPITSLTMTGGVGNGVKDTSPGNPYLDENENGTYDITELYYDSDANSVRQADTPNYVGLLCGGPNPTTLPTLCNGKANSTEYVGSQNVIVMSGSRPVVSWQGAPLAIDLGSGLNNPGNGLIKLYISDANGNAMPGGTKIELLNPPGSVKVSDAQTWQCDSAYYGIAGTSTNGAPNGAQWNFIVSDQGGAVQSGAVTLKITTPRGNATSFPIPVTY